MNDITASFEIKGAFELTDRPFFILGNILSGVIRKGMMADLTAVGIDKRCPIEAIEFALHRMEDNAWEDVGLGLNTLTEAEKALLKAGSPFAAPISIE